MKTFSSNKGLAALWYSFIFGFHLCCTPALALNTLQIPVIQQSQVIGTITDGLNPLPGVTVAVKGKKNNTVITDFNGQYAIQAAPTDVLIISFIGLKTETISINGQKIINIQLHQDATALQEVKINAGYYSVKESERTGSISKITSKDIEKQPVTNVLATMQGRMTGVNITQTTGVSGGGFNIQIRGQNSLRADGNTPLYIVDGVPYATQSVGASQTSTILLGASNPLNSITPSDLESVEVLKDADATAIYGSRGANGVVLITTKKGKKGKTRFTANFSHGAGKVTRFMDLMNTEQYIKMRTEAFTNDGITEYPESAYDINGTWDQNRYTNWQKEFLGGTAEYADTQTTISGGSEQTQFLISGNYHKETTVFPGDFKYTKGNVRVNLNHESENKKFRVNFSSGYTHQNNNQPGTDLTQSIMLPPNAPALYDTDGNLNWENSTWTNPLSFLEGQYKSKMDDLLANMVLSYSILPSLEIKTNLGFTDTRHEETRTQPSTMYDPAYEAGSEYSTIYFNNVKRQSYIIEPQLSWKQGFGKGKAEVLLGSTFQEQNGNQLVQEADGFTSNALIYNLAAATNVFALDHSESVYKYNAFFGRINYSWDDRFIVNLTGRRDGSSRFGPAQQFANFGAVAGAWIFSNQTFVKNQMEFLSFGKLRASYGTSGNDQIGDYQFFDTYGSNGTNYSGTVGLEPTRLFNPDFGWETNKKFEVALETGFFHDRVFITAGWYTNQSSSQLVGIPLPGTTGFSSLQANLDATVQNHGIEGTIRTVNFQRSNFNWSTSFNLTMPRNKLLSFPDLEGSTYSNRYVIDQPLNIVKVYHFTGLDPQTGIYQFEDVNKDGLITPAEDKQTLADFNPKYYGGLLNQITYKRWQLDFLFQFVKQDNYNAEYRTGMPGTMVNQPTTVLDHWQNPGDDASHQQYSAGTNNTVLKAFHDYYASDASITDASYVRLKNFSLSYNLPVQWLQGIQCRATIEGQNMLTITSYKGSDPEFTTIGYLPPLKVFTAGLQFTF
jgi:TonB-linked SusC/RagA family outer membrane protein